MRVDAVPSRTRDLWLVMHPDLAKSPKVQAVAGFLVEAIEDARAAAADGPRPDSPIDPG